MSRTCVIVQARAGSTRLPGKVLRYLSGKTVLSHVLHRCQYIFSADVLCCAVPRGSADDAVAEEAAKAGASVVRGSEHDVLDRYYQAAIECKASAVMRITSDCPLLDPYVADRVLRLVLDEGADYACNNIPRTWPHGLDCEAFTFAWLKRARQQAKTGFEREHVTPFIRENRAVSKRILKGPGGKVSGHRWTLDTEADLRLLQAIYARLPVGPGSFFYDVPLAIVERQPQIAMLNKEEV